MADFATTVPVAQALWPAAEKFLDQKLDWQARRGNYLQELIVDFKEASLDLAATLNFVELASSASNIVKVVNDFLKVQGFSLELQDAGTSRMIYAAAVMKLAGRWSVEGETNYRLPGIAKPAFRISRDAGVKHFVYQGQRIASVPTDRNFRFLVTRPTGASGFRMISDWHNISAGMKSIDGSGLILSMADIGETKIEVTDLIGMSTPDYWVIQEALMAAKFGLTPRAVKFEAAFAFSEKSLSIREVNEPENGDYVADHALYFALMKPGHNLPLAVGLVPVEELSDVDLY